MTIRLRLVLSLAALLAVIAATSISGFFALRTNEQALSSVYADRVVPLRDLKIISDAYAVSIVDLSHKTRAKTLTPQQAVAEINKARTLIDEKWRAYTATKLTAEEAKLVDKVRDLLGPANAGIDRLLQILGRGEETALVAFIEKELYPLIDPVTEAIG